MSVIDKLIKNGEAVDSKTGDGKTALHLAVEVDNLFVCSYFPFPVSSVARQQLLSHFSGTEPM